MAAKVPAIYDLLDACVILKLCHIRQPFFIRCICTEIPVQIVPCDACRIITASGAPIPLPLDRGLDMLYTADPEDALVVDYDAMPSVQFIPDSPVSHIRMDVVDVFDLLRNLLVMLLAEAYRALQPAIVSTA